MQDGSNCFDLVLTECMNQIDAGENCYNNQIGSGVNHQEAEELCKDENKKIVHCIGRVLCPQQYNSMKKDINNEKGLYACAEEKWTKCCAEESKKEYY